MTQRHSDRSPQTRDDLKEEDNIGNKVRNISTNSYPPPAPFFRGCIGMFYRASTDYPRCWCHGQLVLNAAGEAMLDFLAGEISMSSIWMV